MKNLSDIVEEVHAEGSVAKEVVKTIADAVFDKIATSLSDGKDVNIKSFGKFVVADRSARVGRNPKTGEAVQIPASKNVRFKPSGSLKDIL